MYMANIQKKRGKNKSATLIYVNILLPYFWIH